MKAREKLVITLSVLACGMAIAVFALVSLGHFIYTPDRTTLPVVGKMYDSTVQQVALLEPVPVPQAPATAANNSPTTPPDATDDNTDDVNDTALTKRDVMAKNQKNYKAKNKQVGYDDLRKTLSALFGLL